MNKIFRNDIPPRFEPRFWDRKFVIYIASCLGIALTIEIIKSCAFQTDPTQHVNFDIGISIALVILKLASICIIIAIVVIIVKKVCNRIYRHLEDRRHGPFDM
jgi:hypothetical protein